MADDLEFIGVPDPTRIPEALVPSMVNFMDSVCKTDEQRTKAQALLDARDMALNQYLHDLLSAVEDDDEEDDDNAPSNLSEAEEAELLHALGLD
jgi:hypothetical protein